MELYFFIFLIIQLLISLLARNEICEKKFLMKSARFLYRKIFRKVLVKTNAHMKIDKNVSSLHPGKDKEKLISQYYLEKIRLSFALLLAGNILALLVSIHISQNNYLAGGTMVPKNHWKQGSYRLDLSVSAKNQENKSQEIRIQVEPISPTENEISALAEEVFTLLRMEIVGKNLSLSQVTETLNLITRLDKYPFVISWDSDKPLLIKRDGRINNQEIKSGEGEVVKLTAHLLYQDQWTEYRFSDDIYVNLLPYLVAEANRWEEAIIAAVSAGQQESAFIDSFILPDEINGIAVKWHEIKALDGLYLWLMVFAAAIIAFLGQDQDLQKKAVLRNRQVDRDYPELVRKLALYLGAGMTLRGAWKRVAWDYSQWIKKSNSNIKYLYEEMLYSVRELENGVPEREVYEHFGKRVGIAKYRKLMGLLCNHLQKGNKNLLQVLREEMELALEDRKKAARVIGEEMSTKLLLPMMMMLLIVMIMIMIPAFQMF